MTAPTSRPARRTRFAVVIAGLSTVVGVVLAPAAQALPPPASFSSTGAEQFYVVPADVTYVSIQARGARGGTACQNGVPGNGAVVSASFAVSPGSVLWVEVGSPGAPGQLPGPICTTTTNSAFNGGGAQGSVGGGGGGGASDVRTVPSGEPGSLGSRLIVAGGGGGAGGAGSVPGGAGGDAGSPGGGPGGGGAGTLTGPGAAGAIGAPPCDVAPTSGAFGVGGGAGSIFPNNGAGGGGGGYFGGGGGGCNGGGFASGGGGGSSYVAPHARDVSAITTTTAAPAIVVTPLIPPSTVGPQGPPGPQGLPGSPGPVTTRLAIALASRCVQASPGSKVGLRYAATTPSTVRVRLLDGKKVVDRFRGRARAGANQLRLAAPGDAGRYKLKLEATAQSQKATARGRLRVAKGARGDACGG